MFLSQTILDNEVLLAWITDGSSSHIFNYDEGLNDRSYIRDGEGRKRMISTF